MDVSLGKASISPLPCSAEGRFDDCEIPMIYNISIWLYLVLITLDHSADYSIIITVIDTFSY
jgi:hypothetical protein